MWFKLNLLKNFHSHWNILEQEGRLGENGTIPSWSALNSSKIILKYKKMFILSIYNMVICIQYLLKFQNVIKNLISDGISLYQKTDI